MIGLLTLAVMVAVIAAMPFYVRSRARRRREYLAHVVEFREGMDRVVRLLEQRLADGHQRRPCDDYSGAGRAMWESRVPETSGAVSGKDLAYTLRLDRTSYELGLHPRKYRQPAHARERAGAPAVRRNGSANPARATDLGLVEVGC
jgi:hypothetical protein